MVLRDPGLIPSTSIIPLHFDFESDKHLSGMVDG